jgi:3-phenylpropionate/trans-cinnamate dioxygenase ferredoxin subunit
LVRWVKIFSSRTEALQQIQRGKPQLVIVDNVRICVVNHADQFFAVQDSCSHSGESLSKGNVNYLGEVICPLHNHCFNLQTGREISSRSADLVTYPIKIDEDGFYIGF